MTYATFLLSTMVYRFYFLPGFFMSMDAGVGSTATVSHASRWTTRTTKWPSGWSMPAGGITFQNIRSFFDTFFFVLRKKYNHVSLLHVIHHGCMPMSVWFGVKFTPGGHSTFFGLLNTFVHVVMYFYYMVAAMGPRYQKYIWWKKHLTNFQMIQFILIATHAFQLLFIECNYPKAFVWWIGCHGVLFLFLFSSFYTKAYTHSKSSTKKEGELSPKVFVEDKNQSIMNLLDSNSNGIDLRQRKQLKGH